MDNVGQARRPQRSNSQEVRTRNSSRTNSRYASRENSRERATSKERKPPEIRAINLDDKPKVTQKSRTQQRGRKPLRTYDDNQSRFMIFSIF